MRNIAKGEWTASEVLEAYLSRAAFAQEVTNCLTEGASLHAARAAVFGLARGGALTWLLASFPFLCYFVHPLPRPLLARADGRAVMMEEARAQAKALDAEFASTGRLRGPLHGVPVSFKDVCEWLPDPPPRALRPIDRSHAAPRGCFSLFPFLLARDADDVRGHDTTMGYSSRAGKPAEDDSMVRTFRHDMSC